MAGDLGLEAAVLAQLRLAHPHVVALQGVFSTQRSLALVAEHVPGSSLAAALPAGGFDEPAARWLFQQLLFALE